MKNKIAYIYIILTFLFLNSCSVPKFYSEINQLQNDIKYETEKNINDVVNIKIKSNDVNKLVFNKLKKELANTNHIVYFNHPNSSLTNQKYWFVVYDIDCDIYYELESNETNPKKIELIKKSDTLTNNYYSYVFNNYFDNKCELLKKRGSEKLSGLRTYEAIYEIDLKNKNYKKCYFKNFLYME